MPTQLATHGGLVVDGLCHSVDVWLWFVASPPSSHARSCIARPGRFQPFRGHVRQVAWQERLSIRVALLKRWLQPWSWLGSQWHHRHSVCLLLFANSELHVQQLATANQSWNTYAVIQLVVVFKAGAMSMLPLHHHQATCWA